MNMAERPKIVVIGSCMIDLISYTPRLPKPGETLHGDRFVRGFGGKGANQCLAAAFLGASTSLVARLGDDSFGKEYLEALHTNKVNTEFVKITDGFSSGMAQIIVANSGENQIVIVAGANTKLSPSDIKEATDTIVSADVLVFQCETPLNTTVEALKLFSGKGKSIVNGAPGVASPDPQIFTLCDIFCVNETEAEIFTGIPVESIADANRAIQSLLDKGCRTVVITLGPQGVVFATKTNPEPLHVPAKKVNPVDTTGAGDAFIGAMAYYLAYEPQLSLEENIKRSCEIAAITVQTPGTQTSFPFRKDLPQNLFSSTMPRVCTCSK